ncbi:hypothetical protein B0H16DRAFT_1698552 [Mycena metata]|uniref:Uncharacterized protein n=1 Tax=Mycena metata TaxID=1033252 RepID=A0AAD7HPF0_9AGAR|nr:hypothetical protein B0H16DRAFT_1698552 [Mycena metata]
MAKGNGAPKGKAAVAKPKPKQVAKKNQESDGEYDNSVSVPAKRSRKPVDPRSPLPARKGRNVNPGKFVGAVAGAEVLARRTHEEVVEAQSREEARRLRLEALEIQRIAILAEMELEAEQEAIHESTSVVKNIDDHNADLDVASDVGSPYVPPPEFTGQAAMSDDDEMGSGGPYIDNLPQPSSPDHTMDDMVQAQLRQESKQILENKRIMNLVYAEEAKRAAVPVARPRGQKKGDVRMKVDARKAEIKEGKQSGDSQAMDFKRLQALFPTGLKSSWQKATSAASAPSRSSGNLKNSSAKSTTEIATPLGGLIDDDNFGVRPSKGSGAQRSIRKNDLIHFVGDSDDEVEVVAPRKARKIKSNVKTERAVPGPLAATSSVTVVSSSPSPSIPPAIQNRWLTATLPTISHFLGSSVKPFECGSDIDELQEAVQRANPGIQYMLVYGDAVHSKIRSLLYGRRAMFPIQALLVVKRHFDGDEFIKAEDPVSAIADYVAYALRSDGPMLYRTPAPKDIVNPKQVGYTAPQDYCESPFLIDVLKPFVKKIAGSKYDYGFLHGAVGLAAAALEKQFRMWGTGTFVHNPEEFSRDTAGDIIDDYIDNTISFPDHRWARINALCGIPPKDSTPAISVSSKSRRVYVPSSP